MTVEQRVFVRMPGGAASDATRETAARAQAALLRWRKAPPGDRTDAVRFDQINSQIEADAVAAWNGGAEAVVEAVDLSAATPPSGVCMLEKAPRGLPTQALKTIRGWLKDGAVVVEIRWPFAAGPTTTATGAGVLAPVAQTWSSPTGSRGKAAVLERFGEQVARAAVGPDNGGVISPSGVANSVLTEVLREFACAERRKPAARIDVPVVYGDGSIASEPFPLRAIRMGDRVPSRRRIFRFSLISVRHIELDVEVDAAWLRNCDVSRNRPRAETDDFVYQQSRDQLARLTANGPVMVVMYQTGLEAAIVGFYRAVVNHLVDQPRSVAVAPRYFQTGTSFAEGTPWASR